MLGSFIVSSTYIWAHCTSGSAPLHVLVILRSHAPTVHGVVNQEFPTTHILKGPLKVRAVIFVSTVQSEHIRLIPRIVTAWPQTFLFCLPVRRVILTCDSVCCVIPTPKEFVLRGVPKQAMTIMTIN